MTDMLKIDGSVLEGGGQILRNAISLSAILGIPIHVTNIRAGRNKPGLAPQHLKGIEIVAAMCNAKVSGAYIGSPEIQFTPGKLTSGHYCADTQTAGSICLLLQTALPCALFASGAGVTLEVGGGTNVQMAPQIDYMTEVFAPVLRRFGAHFTLTVSRRGYFPKGGGKVVARVSPARRLRCVRVTERGRVDAVRGWSFVAGRLPLPMAHGMAEGARRELCSEYQVDIESYKEKPSVAPDNCNGILLVCESSTGCVLGSDALGSRGVPPREVGARAGGALRTELRSGACLDTHAQDQIIIYMALAEGRSAVRAGEITLHTRTAIYLAELMAELRNEQMAHLVLSGNLGT